MSDQRHQLVAARDENPFSSSKRNQVTAAADVEAQRAIAEVQAAMMLARRFPRDPVQAMDRILNACTRPTLAEGAIYSYSRGGADVTGPSIRLAEAMAQNWGNIQFGVRELGQANGYSTVETFAWDVETNTRQVKVFQVPHVRHGKAGAKPLTDPRDIYEAVANQGARRLRSCILGVIPGDVTDAAVKQCEATMHTTADTSPEALKRLLVAFDEFGVTKEQIESRIQCRLDAIKPAQFVSMRKIYASLKDGMSAAADWFAPVALKEPKNPAAVTHQPQPEAGFGRDTGEVLEGELQRRADPPPTRPAAKPASAPQPDYPPGSLADDGDGFPI